MCKASPVWPEQLVCVIPARCVTLHAYSPCVSTSPLAVACKWIMGPVAAKGPMWMQSDQEIAADWILCVAKVPYRLPCSRVLTTHTCTRKPCLIRVHVLPLPQCAVRGPTKLQNSGTRHHQQQISTAEHAHRASPTTRHNINLF